jgi:hypothetical protein
LDKSTKPRSHENNKFIRETLRHICQGYLAVTDAPASMLVEELLDAYPDAIVIITTRDTDKWWASFEAVKKQVFAIRALNTLFTPLPTVRYFGAWIDAMTRRYCSFSQMLAVSELALIVAQASWLTGSYRSRFLFAKDQQEYELTRGQFMP